MNITTEIGSRDIMHELKTELGPYYTEEDHSVIPIGQDLFNENLVFNHRDICDEIVNVSQDTVQTTQLFIVTGENDKSATGCDKVYMCTSHENIMVKDVQDWTKVVIPFYSWLGCGGVFFFKVYKDFVLFSNCGCFPEFRMWYDGTYEYNSSVSHYSMEYVKKIINGPEIQTIRRLMS